MTETKEMDHLLRPHTNHAKEIAAMLGVELEEKFRIKGHPDMGTFWFVDDHSMGLRDIWDYNMGPGLYDEFENVNDLLEQLLVGFYEVEKLPWKPKRNEEYFYVTNGTMNYYIDHDAFTGTVSDLSRWSVGNCFKTSEDAQRAMRELHENLRKEFEEA